jgi:hypothetical protein
MAAYLISYNGETSEWLNSLTEVQEMASDLADRGVYRITVQQFIDHKLNKSIEYGLIGEGWERV